MNRVIIDADPGTDDALALMMALSSEAFVIEGITTVGGNARLSDTTRNALRLVDYLGPSRARRPAGRQGFCQALKGRLQIQLLQLRDPWVSRARCSPSEPDVRASLDGGAGVHRHVGARPLPGDISLIALGPLTNIARAMEIEPGLAGMVDEIVVMGGAIEVPGNTTPYAEFNVYNDPLAADMVLTSGAPITLVGLDVTTWVYVRQSQSDYFPGISSVGRLANRIVTSWFKAHPDSSRYNLHDPLAMAAAFVPDLMTYRAATVSVETEDPKQLGRTIASYGNGPVRVASDVDSRRAKALIRSLLS